MLRNIFRRKCSLSLKVFTFAVAVQVANESECGKIKFLKSLHRRRFYIHRTLKYS